MPHLAGILVAAVLAASSPGISQQLGRKNSDVGGKVVMCYFGSWSVYRPGPGKFDVEDIDPFVCTHLVFGFAGLHPTKHVIMSLDPYNDLYDNWGRGAFDRFTRLKLYNPGLVTLLAIGGWNEGSEQYSNMALTSEGRTTFIDSCVKMVLAHNFDGLDLDWEYPGGREDSAGRPEDRQNFGLLLREMRAKFDEHGLLLTAAVSAGYQTVNQAYDIPVLAETLDFINLMSYDYHGWFDGHHFTGHNSPLFGRPEEESEDSPGYRWNANYSAHFWLDGGARKSQLLLGLAAYGRGFILANEAESGFFAEATAGCPAGPYTRSEGFWGYNEICEEVLAPGAHYTITLDPYVSAPYAVSSRTWIGYDDPTSIQLKSRYILDLDLGGAMFWSIDTDDFLGRCGAPFSLILTAADELNGGPMTPPPDWTTPDPNYSPTTPEPATPPPTEFCPGVGAQPNPANYEDYYTCMPGPAGGWIIMPGSCGEGLAFNPAIGACDWPANVPGCSTDSTEHPGDTTSQPGGTCSVEEGLLPMPDDCTGWWECVPDENGSHHYEEFHCPEGLVFNAVIQGCDWPSNVPGCEEGL